MPLMMAHDDTTHRVLSREQAKLDYRWIPAPRCGLWWARAARWGTATHRTRSPAALRPVVGEGGALFRDDAGQPLRQVCCPACHAPVVDDEGVPLSMEDLRTKKRRCSACEGPLWWQADRAGPRRFPLAEFCRTRCALEDRPVKRLTSAGAHIGIGVYARSNRCPRAPSESRNGIVSRGKPAALVKSARIWSTMTTTTLGRGIDAIY
jgi:hypothetical protein